MKFRSRIALAFVSVLLSAGATVGAATPAEATDFGPVTGCPEVVTFQTLIRLHGESGSLGRECYGSDELHFVAFRAQPEGLGGALPYVIEPSWLDADRTHQFNLMLTDTRDGDRYSSRWLSIGAPPNLEDRFAALYGQWVAVTGHFDDPVAVTCRVTEGDPAEIPPADAIVDRCRDTFVLTSIEPIETPCPPGDNWAAINATPEHLRARCFGGRALTFRARGGPVASDWPLEVPIRGNWALYDPIRHPKPGEPRLDAFAPPANAVETAAGAVTEGTGILWEIRAHIDDPRAADCRPISGAVSAWDPDDAIEFCRNSLFIDSATWLRPATAGAAPTPTPTSGVEGAVSTPRPSGAAATIPPTDAGAGPAVAATQPVATTAAVAGAPDLWLPLVLLGVLSIGTVAMLILGERLRRT
jgi:hypothetical protein